MKCPDKELLSAYFDNEVPTPYKEAIAEHIHSCEHCTAVMRHFEQLHGILLGIKDEAIPEINEGVLDFCEKKLTTAPSKPHWQITWPVLAAAAAFALFLGIGLSIALFSNRNKETMASTTPVPTVSHYSLSEVVDYLSKQQNSRTIEIPGQIPMEARVQPTIIREADFMRGGK